MDKTKPIEDTSYFTLAGIIPVAGMPLDFGFPWHDSLMPIGKDYLAVERCVYESAMAGCESIWIVCHKEMQPLIRHRIGDWIVDPVWTSANRRKFSFHGGGKDHEKTIPIFYVPIHPKDRDKRDCLSWSVVYGALRAFAVSKVISKWVVPDKYYVSFPYGVHSVRSLRKHRKAISDKKKFYMSHNGKTVRDGEFLSFTFDVEDWKQFRRIIRGGTGMYEPGSYFDEKERTVKGKVLPKDERYSAKHFSLEQVFGGIDITGQTIFETERYYNISSWENYCKYMGSDYSKYVIKPKMILKYHEHSPFGEDNKIVIS